MQLAPIQTLVCLSEFLAAMMDGLEKYDDVEHLANGNRLLIPSH